VLACGIIDKSRNLGWTNCDDALGEAYMRVARPTGGRVHQAINKTYQSIYKQLGASKIAFRVLHIIGGFERYFYTHG
jgi:hypothetical protein